MTGSLGGADRGTWFGTWRHFSSLFEHDLFRKPVSTPCQKPQAGFFAIMPRSADHTGPNRPAKGKGPASLPVPCFLSCEPGGRLKMAEGLPRGIVSAQGRKFR